MKVFELQKKVKEAARIGTSIHKSEIPEKYKQYPLLNRGTTTAVLDAGDSVFLLTKDRMKVDWLVNHLQIATYIETIDTWHPKLKDLEITVLKMPKLYPLSTTTRKAAKDLVKTYDKINTQAIKNVGFEGRNFQEKLKIEILNLFYKYFDEYNKSNTKPHLLIDLIDFLSNYDPNQYMYDIRLANFMQDKEGNLIVLDPIVDSEVLQAFKSK